jgi:tetratricopeptide (TPR) repeat protein
LNQNKTHFLSGIFLFLLFITVFTSCSTRKNTWTRRAYHNLTAHYNVYWNGMDNMRQGTKEFHSSVKDNFTTVIPVYNFGDKASLGKISQFADISIKKASKTIQKHSMVFNKREYNRWIKYAYLLIGKGYFYKQDYPMARHTFEFVIKTYNDKDIKYDGMIWLALTNMQMGDFVRAESMLDMLGGKMKEGKAPEKYEKNLDLTYANFYILQRNYTSAIPYLYSSIDLNLKREMKTRCLFILGQIYQINGNYELASKFYTTVIKRNPPFEFEFNSKINLAECYDSKSQNRDFIIKKLNKMVKEEKNRDYLDQVYYALAQVSLKDKDTTNAIKYLSKSVASSKINNYQKAISSLLLADIYFDNKDYENAQAYYDSTMQFLPKDYPNYKEIRNKTNTLTSLVENLRTIQREDSLQALARMPESKRNQIIDNIIMKIIEEEMKKQQEEQQRFENQMILSENQPGSPGGPSSGGWYFYNSTAMSQGYTTFLRKYGKRKQEDNWFLTDKSVVNLEETASTTDTTEEGDTTKGKKAEKKISDKKDRKFYLQDIPLKPEQITASNDKIIKAYYSAGFIYIEGLKDYEHSTGAFETLLSRFPDNKYNTATCYELYSLYKDFGNQPKSDYYKDLILTRYPETDFAKLLINPNYYKEVLARQQEASHLYEDTYIAYTNQQYYMVIHNYDEAKSNYSKDSTLMPRFAYLRAMALGKIEVQDSLIAALQKLILNYPKSEIKLLAQNVLDYINRTKGGGGQTTPINADSIKALETAQKIYTFNPDAIHFYVLIIDDNKTDVDALKIKISDFNSKYHDLDNLQVNSLLLENSQEMITISTFDNSEKAMSYYASITNSKYIFTKLETSGGYSNFVISADNYPIFYRNKNIQQYLKFFEKNYQPK